MKDMLSAAAKDVMLVAGVACEVKRVCESDMFLVAR
jgi:hypothetical protein